MYISRWSNDVFYHDYCSFYFCFFYGGRKKRQRNRNAHKSIYTGLIILLQIWSLAVYRVINLNSPFSFYIIILLSNISLLTVIKYTSFVPGIRLQNHSLYQFLLHLPVQIPFQSSPSQFVFLWNHLKENL